MKVVLFCGGLGLRLRDYSEHIPKPMVTIGYRPILWHIMRYYAHFGHKDFILCLGYGGDVIKKYFLDYSECISNDFVLSNGGKRVQLFKSDIEDWTITFADTGTHVNIGQRLKAVAKYLEDDEVFLANYGDGLTDLPLDSQIEHFRRENKAVSFLCVKPHLSCHFITLGKAGEVEAIKHGGRTDDIRINGGFFVLRRDVFDYMHEGEDLLGPPFQRLLVAGHRRRERPERGVAMLKLELGKPAETEWRILCLGAHCDDIEIGCGGTILKLTEAAPNVSIS